MGGGRGRGGVEAGSERTPRGEETDLSFIFAARQEEEEQKPGCTLSLQGCHYTLTAACKGGAGGGGGGRGAGGGVVEGGVERLRWRQGSGC